MKFSYQNCVPIALQLSLCVTYSIASLYLFYNVNETSEQVIDEEFHLRQGKHYCNGEFDVVSTIAAGKARS